MSMPASLILVSFANSVSKSSRLRTSLFGMIEIMGQRHRTGKVRTAQLERKNQQLRNEAAVTGYGEKARCFPAKGGEMIGRHNKLQLGVEGS